MKNIALRLRYDGSLYHGWQIQKNEISVAQTVEEALEKALGTRTKVVGCGLGGRMAGFGGASALMIGAGMVPRGEMALITAQIGFNEHVLGSEYYSTIIFIISLVTLVAPLLLKLTIRKVPGVGAAAAGTAGAEQ